MPATPSAFTPSNIIKVLTSELYGQQQLPGSENTVGAH